jgi:hypothetical protein
VRAVLADDDDLAVLHEHHVFGVIQDGRDVGGDEVLVVADADDQRRSLAGGDQPVGLVGRHGDEGIDAAQARQHLAERAGKLGLAIVQFVLDGVRDDLGVGLGDEPVPLRLQLVPQLEVVLDDAVVNHDQPSRAVAVRVGVFLGGPTVRRPARVSEAEAPIQRVGRDDLLQVAQLARRPANRQLALIVDQCDPGRVVAAVLQPAQPLDQHLDGILGSDVANDSAHEAVSPEGRRRARVTRNIRPRHVH